MTMNHYFIANNISVKIIVDNGDDVANWTVSVAEGSTLFKSLQTLQEKATDFRFLNVKIKYKLSINHDSCLFYLFVKYNLLSFKIFSCYVGRSTIPNG